MLRLPSAGAPGSLSANTKGSPLLVDGRAPYIKSLQFVLPDGFDRSLETGRTDDMASDDAAMVQLAGRAGRVATLSTGAQVLIRVDLSGPVVAQGRKGEQGVGFGPRIRLGFDDDDGRAVRVGWGGCVCVCWVGGV